MSRFLTDLALPVYATLRRMALGSAVVRVMLKLLPGCLSSTNPELERWEVLLDVIGDNELSP
jgi:hypothetical protein